MLLGSPQRGLKMHCPKFEQQSAITLKRYEIGCQLVLITNRKSHMCFRLCFRLVLTLMTLNGMIALIFCYFIEFDSFVG